MKETGNAVSYDSGSFRLICYANGTPNGIRIKPAIKVTNGFKKRHTYKIQVRAVYRDVDGIWYDIANSKKFDEINKYIGAGLTPTFWPLNNLSNFSKTVQSLIDSNKYLLVGGKYQTYQIEVRACVGNSGWSKVTITNNAKPPKPTITGITYRNDGHFDIDVKVNANLAVPNNKLHLYYKTDIDEAEWQEIGSGTSLGNSTNISYLTLKSQDISNAHRYKYAVSVDGLNNQNSGKISSGWNYTLPPNVSDVQAERVEGHNYINISFQLPSADIRDRGILTGIKLQRNVNGFNTGGRKIWEDVPLWFNGEEVIVRPVTPTDATLQVVRDSKTSADNYYSYRIVSVNSQHVGVDGEPLAGTDPIYLDPLPPYEYAGFYQSNGNVLLIFKSDSKVATETEIQRSVDGETWDDIATITFQRNNRYTDENPPTDVTLYYRIRNKRDDVVSEWSQPMAIEPLATPNPPTLLSPYNGAKLIRSDTVRLTWMHNPLDNTPQKEAEIEVYQNDTLVFSDTVTTDMYYDVPMSQLSNDGEVTWRVRTMGGDADYSDWSDYGTFYIYQQPQLNISSPANNTTIETLPLHFEMDYTDASGTLSSLTMAIRQGQTTLENINLPTDNTHIEYDLDYLFENGEAYDITISAISTSGLGVTQTLSVTVNYGLISFTRPWYPDVEIDEDTGIVTVSISEGEFEMADDEDDPTTYVDEEVVRGILYRNTAQGRVKIADTVTLGQQFVDMYAPLNQDYTYELLMVSAEGKISVLTQIVHIDSQYWYVYWGPNHENICRALWNPQGDVSLKRPEKQLIRYSGREYPVSYDSTAMEETFAYGGVIDSRDELNNFIAMIKSGGTGIWHSANGEAYDASFDFDYNADYTSINLLWDCKLNVTRIDK